jgi:hypothetical protein
MRRNLPSVCLALAAALAAACGESRRFEVQATASGSLVTLPGEPARVHETPVYTDREYTFTRLTGLAGTRHLATANDDKAVAARSFLELEAGPGATVYLALDRRAGAPPVPRWLAEEGFRQSPPCHPTRYQIAMSDSAPRWEVYCRPPRGRRNRLILGGNVDQPLDPTASLSMYLIFYRGGLTPVRSDEIEPALRSAAPRPEASQLFRQLPPRAADAMCMGGPLPGPAQLLQWSRGVPRQRADLRCVQLPRLDFSGASLDLGGSDLIAANLQFANLSTAVLDRAEMEYANLADATLARTSLRRANLAMADLSRARLVGADLMDANLRGARLEEADFTDANLAHAIFEPQSLTSARKIGRARGLEWLRYVTFPDALVSLRDSFKQAGFHHEERQVTAAIERQKEARAPWYGRWARRLLIGMTCDYGLAVTRPLWLIGASLLLFPWLYWLCARWLPGSKLQLVDGDAPSAPRDLPPGRQWPYYFQLSLASAFALGDQFGVGKWIERLLPTTNSVRARGLLRTLAGLQSLLDLLLLGLWALIFLGRPFE